MVKKDALELRFAVTACDRCGGARLLRQPCPDCGLAAKVHEVQPDVDRRRDLVAAFRAGRKQAPGESVRPEHALHTAPLSAFRENSSIDADTVAGLLAYARLCGQAEVNGSSWLSPAQWDAVAQRITTLAEGLPPTERNGPVRQIRAWARAAGADRAVETCTAWMRERRLGADRG